jgi:anthranilate synthase/aminodeoxychorismate synthase-like glutamine amidotransferase
VILLIDNYDSFVHNLARYVRELGWDTEVVRNDRTTTAAVLAAAPEHMILSPGPCTPDEAGVCLELVREMSGTVPILGVCLGHQVIGQAFGGRVARARRPMHGRTSPVRHDGSGPFRGLPSPLRVTRYHSLVVAPEDLPPVLRATAWSDEGEIMALRHAAHPTVGVQFHPEALLTRHGHALLANVLGRPARGGV